MTLEQSILGFLAFVVIAVALVVLDDEKKSKRKYGEN